MIIDQLIHQRDIGISEDATEAEILDMTLPLDESGKISSESLGTIEVNPKDIYLNKAPDSANNTIKWTKGGLSGKDLTPFKGIPVEKGKTQVKTLLKMAYVLYKAPHFSEKLLELGIKDLEKRQTNAKKLVWKSDGAPKDPDSSFKNSIGIKLPCVGKTSKGWVILGLKSTSPDKRVDSNSSIKLTDLLTSKNNSTTNCQAELGSINLSLHVGDGLGRNNFGRQPKVKDLSKLDFSEYARVFGLYEPINLDLVRTQFSQYLNYPMKVWPVPDSSHLAFFCKNEKDYNYTKQVLDTLREERYRKKGQTEDDVKSEKKTIHTFPTNIGNKKVTIALVCPEGGNKTKTIVSEIFPSIPLYYWFKLESELTNEYVPLTINEFNRVIVNGPKGKPSPASYKMWTKILTNLLNGISVPAHPFWAELSKFHKSYPNANLWNGEKAPKGAKNYELNKCRTWFYICRKLSRLNKIIELYDSGELEKLRLTELNNIMNNCEKRLTDKEANKLAKERVGDLWDLLSDLAQKKISNAIAITETSMSERDKTSFTKGLVCGSALSYASYALETKAKRKFEPGSGMHLSQLRGKNLSKEFTKATTLAENFNRGKSGEKRVYPLPIGSLIYFKAFEKDSLKEAFNNGLVCGFGLPKVESEETTTPTQNP